MPRRKKRVSDSDASTSVVEPSAKRKRDVNEPQQDVELEEKDSSFHTHSSINDLADNVKPLRNESKSSPKKASNSSGRQHNTLHHSYRHHCDGNNDVSRRDSTVFNKSFTKKDPPILRNRGGMHFVRGGNARDPLNLKNVRPEDPFRPPTSRPIEVVVPKDVSDPLGLKSMPNLKKMNRKRKKKRRREKHLEEMIVSPAFCQRRFFRKRSKEERLSLSKRVDEEMPPSADVQERPCSSNDADAEKPKKVVAEDEGVKAAREEKRRRESEKYRYGNYNHYRQRLHGDPFQMDPRVEIFCEDWFTNKLVLDIGCGAGLFTTSVARRFDINKIMGVDIDPYLIGAAQKTLRHFADKHSKVTAKFPASFGLNFGPIAVPRAPSSDSTRFPHNVLYKCENFVPKEDDDLDNIPERFDIALAIRVVKWIHLNWGDAGLKRFFQRIFREMKTGGRFIVEIEGLEEYLKLAQKRRMTPTMVRNFENISLKPDDFVGFLLSEDVGFKHHECLNSALAKNIGWAGKLYVFYKGEFMIQ